MALLYDLHVHLDFAKDPRDCALALKDLGLGGCLSCTVVPEDYLHCLDLLEGVEGIRVGLGLHPWWISDGRATRESLELFLSLAPKARYIGEIGLDLTRRAREAFPRQSEYLRSCLHAATQEGAVFSFHSSHAASALLDLIEQTRLTDRAQCILHWFNGSSDDLQRALKLGCYLSINQRMLSTKRGQAYSKVIPANRLLLETDGPSEKLGLDDSSALFEDLTDTLLVLEALRQEKLADILADTSVHLLKAANIA